MNIHEKMMRQHGAASGSSDVPNNKFSYEVGFKSKKQVAVGTYEFVFEKPSGFSFTAGQHVRMTLIDPPQTDSKGNSRFLTLASTPSQPDLVVTMHMSDSAFKRTLGNMQPSQKVLIEMLAHSPKGAFALHQDADTPAIFLMGGIGIVPAYSIIKDALQRGLKHKMYLFYSNRRPKDAPYLDELQQLANKHPSFRLIATFTETQKSAQTWQGETGVITPAMLKKYVNDIGSSIYYIAGLSGMVGAMKTMISSLGISPDQVRAEEFDGFNMDHDMSTNRSWNSRLQAFLSVKRKD